MDNSPTHNDEKRYTSPRLFSRPKGMNAMISVLQPHFHLYLTQGGNKFTPRCVFRVGRVSVGRVILYTLLARVHNSPNWRQESG